MWLHLYKRAGLTATFSHVGEKKKGVSILDIILHVSEEKWLPRIGSLIYLEIVTCFLQKSITLCTLLSKNARDMWTSSILPTSEEEIQCT